MENEVKTYIITYDLKAPGRNYDALYRLLGSWNAARIAESVWIAQLTATSSAVRDAMKAVTDPNDLIAVFELTPNAQWAVSGANPAGLAKLKQLVP